MWEAIFMLLILKIPVIYLCCIVYWAIKAEPKPYEGALRTVPVEPDPQPGWWWKRRALRPRRPRGGPHGVPLRSYARREAVVASSAKPQR